MDTKVRDLRNSPALVNMKFDRPLRTLSLKQIKQIDDTLAQVGISGEVRLIKNKGELRFIMRICPDEHLPT
jgi:hypothetical protein